MATTGEPGNIPLLDDNSPITPIQAPFNATAVALNEALKAVTSRKSGTFGFASGMSTIAGSTNTISIRGDVVTWHASIQCSSNINSGFNVGTVPTGFRPSDQVAIAANLVSGTPKGACTVFVNPDGSVTTGYVSTTASNQIRFEASWVVPV